MGGVVLASMVLEVAVRMHVEGGLAPALASLFGGKIFREVQAAESWYVTDPHLGYALSPSQPGINALGIRHGEIELPKPPGSTRVILLGDSLSFDEAGFADRLADSWRERDDAELINAAIPGYTTYQERALLERRLIDLEPDLVLVQYCLNDNHRFLHRIAPDGKRLLTPEAKRALIPEGDGVLSAFARWSYLVVEVRRKLLLRETKSKRPFAWEGREDLAPAWREESWREVEEHLSAIRDLCRDRGAALAVVAFPIEVQFEQRSLADRERTMRPQRFLSRACSRLGIPLLDLTQEFERAPAPAELFRDGLHLSDRGHSLAEQEVDAFLRREDLLGSNLARSAR